ncbi:Short chain dehydrogenase-like protein 49 [Elsinoe fawcettii]|nr:Short chain dehydrogenase-like protein 49 [Elsinoe fawcettii]
MASPTSPPPSTAKTPPPPSPKPSTSPKNPPTQDNPDLKPPRVPKFPTHNAPRVWFLTSASSPIGISLSRHLLSHGDYIVAGVSPSDLSIPTSPFRLFLAEIASSPAKESWKPRLKPVPLDVRVMGQCQSAIADAVASFGRIDILFSCAQFSVVGAVEELASSPLARTLVRDQFEVNFFGAVNVIKAVLPTFRAKRNGHIVVLTGITGHLGTPGLGIYCASQWAIEGYCDSLAYEVAPFNIRTTIVQPNVEVGVLTNKVVGAPPLGYYQGEANGAPLFRDILSGLLDRLEGVERGREGTEGTDEGSVGGPQGPTTGDLLHQSRISEVTPSLAKGLKERLVAETVYAVAAIGGHDNPPSRHIVGHEGVASVKEKLKTVSEELEDFVEVSAAVDIGREEMPGLVVPS